MSDSGLGTPGSGEAQRFWKSYDWTLLSVILILCFIGLLTLYSSTYLSRIDIFYKQIAYFSGGFILMTLISLIDYRVYERLAYPVYYLSVALLGLVLLVGRTAQGSQRWLDLGVFNLQPSEIMKLSLVLVLARFYSVERVGLLDGFGFRDLMPVFLLMGIPMVLVFAQPDLGTTIMIASVAFSIVFFCKLKIRTLVTMIVLVSLTAPLAYNFALHDYQRDRVKTFLNPQRDPLGEGYHSIQSMIAVGSGQFVGKGYQRGTQSKLEFLPKHHTDFIFSAFAEEWGFIGAMTVLGLFALLVLLGVDVARKSKDRFGSVLAIGCLALVVWHVIVNIGMEIGILPVVGVTLPFFSYGGSSLLTNMIAMGIVLSVSVRRFIF